MKVTLYTKENCPLCEKADQILLELKSEFPLEIQKVDIYTDENLLETYQLKIPVIAVSGKELDYGNISRETLRRKLQCCKAKYDCQTRGDSVSSDWNSN